MMMLGSNRTIQPGTGKQEVIPLGQKYPWANKKGDLQVAFFVNI
jgi:hypothetical protein